MRLKCWNCDQEDDVGNISSEVEAYFCGTDCLLEYAKNVREIKISSELKKGTLH